MNAVKSTVISRLRDQLIRIKYKEVVGMEDEELKEVICHTESSWIKLIKWLTEQLMDDEFPIGPDNVESKGIKTTIVGLGLCNRNASERLISGKATPAERVKFLSHLVSRVEMMKSVNGNSIEKDCSSNYEKIKKILASEGLAQCLETLAKRQGKESRGKEKKVLQLLAQNPRSIDVCIEENILHQDSLANTREMVEERRKEIGLNEENVAGSEALKQLCRESENLSERLVVLTESIKPLAEKVKEVFDYELSEYLPVNVTDPLDLPYLDSLSEKVECILQVQEDEKTVENSVSTLMHKAQNEILNAVWSTRETSSLPLFQVHEDSRSVVMTSGRV